MDFFGKKLSFSQGEIVKHHFKIAAFNITVIPGYGVAVPKAKKEESSGFREKIRDKLDMEQDYNNIEYSGNVNTVKK